MSKGWPISDAQKRYIRDLQRKKKVSDDDIKLLREDDTAVEDLTQFAATSLLRFLIKHDADEIARRVAIERGQLQLTEGG